MAIAKVLGVVKGYTEGDDGNIYLSVEELEHSPTADDFVDEMRRNFNPQSAVHGFGARDIPCNIRPGYANYHVSITPDEAKNITQGCRVEMEMEFFNVRKVVLTGQAGKRRWAAIPEIRHKVWTIKVVRDNQPATRPDDRPSDKADEIAISCSCPLLLDHVSALQLRPIGKGRPVFKLPGVSPPETPPSLPQEHAGLLNRYQNGGTRAMDGIGEFMVKGILAGFTLGAAFHIVAWALTRAVVLVGEMLNGD